MNLDRSKIIERILPRARYLGMLETTEGEVHVCVHGKLALWGTACNVGLLLDGFALVEPWEDAAQVAAEHLELIAE